MERRHFLRLLWGGTAAAITGALGGCEYDDRYDRRDWRYRRRDPFYEYYYYPDSNVYFHLRSGDYYYYDRNRWHRTRRLPHNFRLQRHRRRRLYLREPHPYLRNREHRREWEREHRRARERRERERRESRNRTRPSRQERREERRRQTKDRRREQAERRRERVERRRERAEQRRLDREERRTIENESLQRRREDGRRTGD